MAPVIGIICLANEKCIVEGRQYCNIPVVRYDRVIDLLDNYVGGCDVDIDKCMTVIENAKCDVEEQERKWFDFNSYDELKNKYGELEIGSILEVKDEIRQLSMYIGKAEQLLENAPILNTYSDGRKEYIYKEGNKEKEVFYANGKREVYFVDGSKKVYTNGDCSTYYTDGGITKAVHV